MGNGGDREEVDTGAAPRQRRRVLADMRCGMFIDGSKAVSYSSAWVRLPTMNLIENKREKPMSDDKSKSHGQDRERINVNQEYELRDWAKSLKTTPERVKEAVQAVGDRADKVREYLGERDKSGS